MKRYLLPMTVVVFSSIGLMYCGETNQPCGPSNCGGCCNASGACVNDVKNSECGRKGEACSACSGAETCMDGTCLGPMGGGSGSMGGGTGATGGGTNDSGTPFDAGHPDCTPMPWSPIGSNGSYVVPTNGNAPYHDGVIAADSQTANSIDRLKVELWYFGANQNFTAPGTIQITDEDWSLCSTCLILHTACDASTGEQCTKSYLAQSGTLEVSSGVRNVSTGSFAGAASAVKFREWNFTLDLPVVGGGCVEIASLSFATSWAPVDAGVDAGVTVDAGIDGGVTVDAGVDAGVTVDAGIDAGLTLDAGAEVDAGIDAGVVLP